MQKGELRRFKKNTWSDEWDVEGATFVVLDEDRSNWAFRHVSILVDGRIERGWPSDTIERETELVSERE